MTTGSYNLPLIQMKSWPVPFQLLNISHQISIIHLLKCSDKTVCYSLHMVLLDPFLLYTQIHGRIWNLQMQLVKVPGFSNQLKNHWVKVHKQFLSLWLTDQQRGIHSWKKSRGRFGVVNGNLVHQVIG